MTEKEGIPEGWSWSPVSDAEFEEIFTEQLAALSVGQRKVFDRYRVPFWKATIRRSRIAGDEYVFVVAETSANGEKGILYFDDVEEGFNVAKVDGAGTIIEPGGSQASLREAVSSWFPDSSGEEVITDE